MPTEPPTLLRLFTPQFDATSVVPGLAVVALIAYLLGVRALRRRRLRWPWHRTVTFVAGIVTVLLVTATQVMGYGMMLFSIHMLQKMSLTVVSAMLLMLGAPVSLAIRALPRRGWGAVARRLLLRALRSKLARLLAHPVVTTVIFVGSLYALYFTPVFDFLMRSWWGNVVMLLFFLSTGLLAFGGAFALGPWPHRASPPARLAELVVPGPLHAFFAVALMMASTPVVRTFANPPPGWGIDVMTDQLAAGNIVWGFGEVPSIIAVAIVYLQWTRSEETLTKVSDRRVDADLEAYNAHLRRLAEDSPRG
ncbi:cytochrome c oxidase assembly protein [Blastococcus sp. KM273128]|uniref:cytochrome c oxidase assembly protein n=1 Tax=Blastococcus sp. KM273128 TaxID=2570314 RepID=UPI001F1FB676|nr:cytochrome c oxidase assembly protein [Blastococcus sp. KM273128]MCF6746136.1 cytochrome c oxidase assembly protein [Blastococcus sp. KM273128]